MKSRIFSILGYSYSEDAIKIAIAYHFALSDGIIIDIEDFLKELNLGDLRVDVIAVSEKLELWKLINNF